MKEYLQNMKVIDIVWEERISRANEVHCEYLECDWVCAWIISRIGNVTAWITSTSFQKWMLLLCVAHNDKIIIAS